MRIRNERGQGKGGREKQRETEAEAAAPGGENAVWHLSKPQKNLWRLGSRDG